MTLSREQLQAVQDGNPVQIVLDRTECVVLRKDVFDHVQILLGDTLDADAVYSHMEEVMAEDDANDPLLESYQSYKR